jgi:hypothetical protein
MSALADPRVSISCEIGRHLLCDGTYYIGRAAVPCRCEHHRSTEPDPTASAYAAGPRLVIARSESSDGSSPDPRQDDSEGRENGSDRDAFSQAVEGRHFSGRIFFRGQRFRVIDEPEIVGSLRMVTFAPDVVYVGLHIDSVPALPRVRTFTLPELEEVLGK